MCIYSSASASSGSNDSHSAGRPLTYKCDAHIIPQGLGQNAKIFPSGWVCDGCNRYFGNTLEPALIRHPMLAYDMQRLGVPGKDGGPREILGNWRREPDGSVLVPMVPPQDSGKHRGAPVVGFLPILDPTFDQLRFRRGLHLLAFNVLSHLHATDQTRDAVCDPCLPRYDAVRRYIRAPRNPLEAWPFLERYDRLDVGGKVEVNLFNSGGVIFGRIRAYSLEFYVDLMNTGTLLPWAEAEGITPVRMIAPGVRYPASPTENEVSPEDRWWLQMMADGRIRLLGPKGEEIELTPVAEPSRN